MADLYVHDADGKRLGRLHQVGWAYPASAADPEARRLIEAHGDEYGPWQVLDLDDRKSRLDRELYVVVLDAHIGSSQGLS